MWFVQARINVWVSCCCLFGIRQGCFLPVIVLLQAAPTALFIAKRGGDTIYI